MKQQNGSQPREENSQQQQRNQWTEEQRLNAGSLASHALNNPVFQVIHNLLTVRYFEEFQRAPLEHQKAMQELKLKTMALQELLLQLGSLAAEAEKILQERAKQNDPVEKEKARIDSLGFN